MEGDRGLSLRVGAFVLLALAGLATAILSISSQSGIFTPRYALFAHFQNVQGLVGGASVRLAGTRVGRVERVSLGARPTGEPAVEVVLHIERAVQQRIRSDSSASIGTIGLLGDRYVEIAIGTGAGRVLQDGDGIPSVDPRNLDAVIDRGAVALDNIATLAGHLNSVFEEFDRKESGVALVDSLAALGDIANEVREGEGLLHSLIYDEYAGSGVESIESSLATLEKILKEIDEGEGVLHTLIYEAPEEQDVVFQVLEAGARLNSILAKIDRGEGTFGLLLNDPTLYEELKLLVGGANRSAVVRTMIRMATDDED